MKILLAVLLFFASACSAADPDALVATDDEGTTVTLLARVCESPEILANVEAANAVLTKHKAPTLIAVDEFYAGAMTSKGAKPVDICWALIGAKVVVVDGSKDQNVYAIPPAMFNAATEI
jgi:hypothetical protein